MGQGTLRIGLLLFEVWIGYSLIDYLNRPKNVFASSSHTPSLLFADYWYDDIHKQHSSTALFLALNPIFVPRSWSCKAILRTRNLRIEQHTQRENRTRIYSSYSSSSLFSLACYIPNSPQGTCWRYTWIHIFCLSRAHRFQVYFTTNTVACLVITQTLGNIAR